MAINAKVKQTITTSGWLRAAIVRAITAATQAAGALITVDTVVWEHNWPRIAGTAATAAILSLIWSLNGLPEVSGGDTESST